MPFSLAGTYTSRLSDRLSVEVTTAIRTPLPFNSENRTRRGPTAVGVPVSPEEVATKRVGSPPKTGTTHGLPKEEKPKASAWSGSTAIGCGDPPAPDAVRAAVGEN